MENENRARTGTGDVEELAAYTDAVLRDGAGKEVECPELGEVVRLLARTIKGEQPPERLRRRVRACIAEEWESETPSLWERLRRSLGGTAQRRAWAAVAALAVVAVAVALLVPPSGDQLPATAVGDGGLAATAGVAILLGALLFALWHHLKK
jgi:hypothetical protein